jgi:hypothetical protein
MTQQKAPVSAGAHGEPEWFAVTGPCAFLLPLREEPSSSTPPVACRTLWAGDGGVNRENSHFMSLDPYNLFIYCEAALFFDI